MPTATVTAADLLQTGGDADKGRVLDVDQIDPDDPSRSERWLDDLACWTADRHAGQRPLPRCVVTLSAPELTGDHLVGVPQMAQIAEIAPSTLRAYIARGEDGIPQPQGARTVGAGCLPSTPGSVRMFAETPAEGPLLKGDDRHR